MKLSEFANKTKKLLVDFQVEWLDNNRSMPEEYPFLAEPTEFLSRFVRYLENKWGEDEINNV